VPITIQIFQSALESMGQITHFW